MSAPTSKTANAQALHALHEHELNAQRAPARRSAMGTHRGLGRLLSLIGFSLLIVAAGVAYPLALRGPELLSCTFDRPWFLLGLLLVPWVYYRGTLGEDSRQVRL